MKKETTGPIFIPAWMLVLREIGKGKVMSDINVDLKIMYSWVHKICKSAEKKGWITRKKQGRLIIYTLTEKGELVALLSRNLIDLIKKENETV